MNFDELVNAITQGLRSVPPEVQVSIRTWSSLGHGQPPDRVTCERTIGSQLRYMTLFLTEFEEVSFMWGQWPFPPGSEGHGFDSRGFAPLERCQDFLWKWLVEGVDWQKMPSMR